MCGICGVLGESNKDFLGKMMSAVAHRGPDDSGSYFDKNISLGVTRLSIVDVKGGRQPLSNENEDVFVIFNGEIYNFKELRLDLEKKGHKFKTDCDTEVIVHSYEEYGTNCVNLFDGMFSFALWDAKKKELFLARDPLGIKPFFYTWSKNKFIFASEIKSIFQSDDVKRSIDSNSIYERFVFGHHLSDNTLFTSVKELLPGHKMIIGEKIVYEPYWKNKVQSKKISEKDALKELEVRFKKSIEKRIKGNKKVGIFLSGGLDSSLVLSAANLIPDVKIKTFTVGNDEENKDVKNARLVSEHFSTNHEEVIYSTEEYNKMLPKYLHHIEDIYPVGAGPLILSKKAKKFSKVFLCGQGSDELFGGYSKYKNIEKEIAHIKNHFEMVKFLGKDINREKARKKYYSELMFNLKSNGFSGMLYLDQGNKLSKNQLAPTDRTTMAHGIEMRIPYMDINLLEFINRLPSNLKMKGNNEKYLLRKLGGKMKLPKEIWNREKYMPSIDVQTNDDVLGKKIVIKNFGNKELNQIMDKKQVEYLKNIENLFLKRNSGFLC